jgi:hypothetical protein
MKLDQGTHADIGNEARLSRFMDLTCVAVAAASARWAYDLCIKRLAEKRAAEKGC